MKLIPAIAMCFTCCVMAAAQPVPVDVRFKMLDIKDPYGVPYPPVPGAKVRLVLGEDANWQKPDAGHTFVTGPDGEARFTMQTQLDNRWQSRNVGFTPIRIPGRTEHLRIGVELDHEFPGIEKVFRWLLTMDVDCFRDGTCSTVGFMGIYTPDERGNFTKPLPRVGSTESWKVEQLGGQVMWGMTYDAADFLLSTVEGAPGRRSLSFAVKKRTRVAR